jgi:hypothetical protein
MVAMQAHRGNRKSLSRVTPDDWKILLACGRSNNVVVVDASSYKAMQAIEGFKVPWGIVTYPRAFGSLELP